MTGLRGVFAGVLALIALEAVLSRQNAANRVSGLFGNLAGIIDHLLDPGVAAIPDVAHYYDGVDTSTSATTTAAAQPPATNTSEAHIYQISTQSPANNKPKPPKAPVVVNI